MGGTICTLKIEGLLPWSARGRADRVTSGMMNRKTDVAYRQGEGGQDDRKGKELLCLRSPPKAATSKGWARTPGYVRGKEKTTKREWEELGQKGTTLWFDIERRE